MTTAAQKTPRSTDRSPTPVVRGTGGGPSQTRAAGPRPTGRHSGAVGGSVSPERVLDREVRVRKDAAVADDRPARSRHRAERSRSEEPVPDDELMRVIYREHAGPLLAYVLRLVAGDRHRAEDVVQETLVRAWRNVHRLNRATGSVRPWLVTVARRIVIDGHRSRQARPQEVDPAPLEVMPAEDEIDKALWLMTLSDALGDLSDAHREVLVETYFKGRTVNEAAETLGIPSGTVRSRVFYALRSMKLALEERGVRA
ncbi:RNA polymerase subunit sigma [Streptomyces sp. Ru87]|nr:RNA polymerase subunit sigma [Streptomyces sp. Ru87]